MAEKDPQKSNPDEMSEQEKRTRHKLRMRFEYSDLIEDIIQDAQEAGAFDNLRGQGKPLALKDNPYEGDRSLANALLKEHDLLPAWLLQRNSIGVDREALRGEMTRTYARYQQAYELTQNDGRRGALAHGWRQACAAWAAEVERLNRQIDSYNLGRPSEGLELVKLRLEDELRRSGAALELG